MSIILPLYSYPSPGAWDPLFTAASAHPTIKFDVIVNPGNGPGGSGCPEPAWITVLQQVANYDNIRALGYVHTADQYDCGDSGTDICVTSAPVEEVNANVTSYAGWASCGNGVDVDGIFFDESPYTADPNFVQYMQTATSHARSALPQNKQTLVFNAGAAVQDPKYWTLADFICVMETSGSQFQKMGGPSAVQDGTGAAGEYADQAAVILYGYENGVEQLNKDVKGLVGLGVGAVSISDATGYMTFGDKFEEFVDALDVAAN